MVATFNIERDNIFEKHAHVWPNNPSYKEGRNPILRTPEWNLEKETEEMGEEDIKELEKKKSIIMCSTVCQPEYVHFQGWN
jgi:hypothetical protein